jgi:glutaredoxin-like protein NrdH
MELTHVKGKKTCDIKLYALSTCGWCKKTKKLLNDRGIDYSYVDVDLLDDEDNARAMEEVERWNPSGSFPTVVINGQQCIPGYKPDELLKAIGE